jgi:hypothetical protein
MANQLIFAIPRMTDANGDAASGAQVNFYQTGTTTPVTVYSDVGLSVAHPSPLVADSSGKFAQVFYGGPTEVKAIIKDSDDNTLLQLDPCPLIVTTSSAAESITFSPVSGNAATDVQEAIENNTLGLASKIANTRTVTAGVGLVGGGDLSNDRIFAIDEADDAALLAGTDGKFPDAATVRAGIDDAAIGVGQTWQAVTRTTGTSYQNTTGRSIQVSFRPSSLGSGNFQVSDDDSTWVTIASTGAVELYQISAIIPPDIYYRLTTVSIAQWAELR